MVIATQQPRRRDFHRDENKIEIKSRQLFIFVRSNVFLSEVGAVAIMLHRTASRKAGYGREKDFVGDGSDGSIGQRECLERERSNFAFCLAGGRRSARDGRIEDF